MTNLDHALSRLTLNTRSLNWLSLFSFLRPQRTQGKRLTHEEIETLKSLDDHLLRDIGLGHGDIARAVRTGRLTRY